MITGRTDSGMLYGVKRSCSKAAWCSVSIRCGTRDEEGYPEGIAHFTEHCIFKGTEKRKASNISSYIDSLGGELNAYTTKEEIVVHSTVLREDIGKACRLILDLVTNPTFPEREIDTERGVVMDEILSCRDCPADDVYDNFESLFFEGHPLSRMILGSTKSVKKIGSEQLRRFVREKFVPGAMAMTIVADMDEKKMEALVHRLSGQFFGDSRSAIIAGHAPETMAAPQTRFFQKTVDKRNHEVNAVIGAEAPSLYGGQRRIASVLLGNMLAGPASNSILGSLLRERNGWVYGVEMSYTQYTDCGIMAISLGCDRANIDKCLAAVNGELGKICSKPLSDNKLKAAKRQILGQMAISSDSGEAQCLSMGKSLLSYGSIDPDDKVKANIEGISAQELMSCAQEIFKPEKISQLIYI